MMQGWTLLILVPLSCYCSDDSPYPPAPAQVDMPDEGSICQFLGWVASNISSANLLTARLTISNALRSMNESDWAHVKVPKGLHADILSRVEQANCSNSSFSLSSPNPHQWDLRRHPWGKMSSLDAAAAAPKNHLIMKENQALRVVNVYTPPFHMEDYHHHMRYSMFVHYGIPTHGIDHDENGTATGATGDDWDGKSLPRLQVSFHQPQWLHSVLFDTNTSFDLRAAHCMPSSAPSGCVGFFFRVEFKLTEGEGAPLTLFLDQPDSAVPSVPALVPNYPEPVFDSEPSACAMLNYMAVDANQMSVEKARSGVVRALESLQSNATQLKFLRLTSEVLQAAKTDIATLSCKFEPEKYPYQNHPWANMWRMDSTYAARDHYKVLAENDLFRAVNVHAPKNDWQQMHVHARPSLSLRWGQHSEASAARVFDDMGLALSGNPHDGGALFPPEPNASKEYHIKWERPRWLRSAMAAASGSIASAPNCPSKLAPSGCDGYDYLIEFKGFSSIDRPCPQCTSPPPASLPKVAPVALGQTYFSSSPNVTANFFVDHLGAKPVEQNITRDSKCAKALSVELRGYVFSFVQDFVKRAGKVPAATVASNVEDQMEQVFAHKVNYSWWEDSHPGINNLSLVSSKKLLASGIPYQYYVNSLDHTRSILRTMIPGTSWTIELNGISDEQKADFLDHAWPLVGNPDPDEMACRNNTLAPTHGGPGWWKTTYAAPDADAAADFAVRYLGAWKVTSPFPAPRVSGCSYVTWVQFPNGFMLHFVESPQWPVGSVSPSAVAEDIDTLRKAHPASFDRHHYNHLSLWVGDLDPFVKLLVSDNVPIVARDFGSGLYGVFVTLPNNGQTIELRSETLTLLKPVKWNECAQETTDDAKVFLI